MDVDSVEDTDDYRRLGVVRAITSGAEGGLAEAELEDDMSNWNKSVEQPILRCLVANQAKLSA